MRREERTIGRPHIEFIQTQRLPWRASRATGRFAGTDVKVLSQDDETRAATLLVRYGPDWSREQLALAVDEEFFVLDGELRIDDQVYSDFSYGFLPAGYPRSRMAAAEGTVVLSFVSGDPDSPSAATRSEGYDKARLVVKIDALDSPWYPVRELAEYRELQAFIDAKK